MSLPYDWLDLHGKVGVVNGAASGIGAAIATALIYSGARVALLDRNLSGCQELQKSLTGNNNDKIIALACDITDEAQVRMAAAQVKERWGPCQLLVNAAGITRPTPLADIELEDWNAQLAVNLNGYLLCAREFGRQMREAKKGAMVHISSISAHQVQPFSGAYSPGKAAVSMLSKQLAVEWGHFGIRSNCISPGMMITPMTAAYYQHPGVKLAREAFTTVGRIGIPEDVANAALFLLSERSAYISGTEILVDGGLSTMLMGKISRPGYDAENNS